MQRIDHSDDKDANDKENTNQNQYHRAKKY